MRIRLQQLEHQSLAIKALAHVFTRVPLTTDSVMPEANPVIDLTSAQLRENIDHLQQGLVEGVPPIPKGWRSRVDDGTLGLDIRMETGTGKTYVYTKLMHELHKQYDFHKFIILTPSVSIKEGTKSFINADYARTHFGDEYGHETALQLHTLEPQKTSKKRKPFPTAVQSYAVGSRLQKNRIHALLMTSTMLTSDKTMDHSFDQMMLDSASRPYEVLQQTRPIVIIDEPHRFKREQVTYKRLIEMVRPQAVIRFGATFPQTAGGRDFNNLVFNLGAIEAFNDRLVKGVAVQYPQSPGSKSARLQLTSLSASKPKTATFKNVDDGKSITLGLNSSLSEAHPDFSGITVEGIGATANEAIRSGVTLSNDLVLARGSTVASGVFSGTYQKLMLERAIGNHLDIECDNFLRVNRVKTLSLFFIDSIESYRAEDGAGHLRQEFELLLRTALKNRLLEFEDAETDRTREYREYLQASIDELAATNGGYFAQDNSTADDAVRAEVNQILRDKQGLLSFRHADGSWNTRRFIFSKWTLREGWDNPNVFQIVKLRSSGSEISKLQEVGRGLRLPVDEQGTRLSNEQFYLTYLVDFSEEEFADTLVAEVNAEAPLAGTSVKDQIDEVAAKRGMTSNALAAELLGAELVDLSMNILEGKADELYERYPEFNRGVGPDKIIRPGKLPRAKVAVRDGNFAKIKDLWADINQRYYLDLPNIPRPSLSKLIDEVLEVGKSDIYVEESQYFTEDKVITEDDRLTTSSAKVHAYKSADVLRYGDWLQRASTRTHLPIYEIHAGLIRRNTAHPLADDFFTLDSLGRFVRSAEEKLRKEVQKDLAYHALPGVYVDDPLLDSAGRVRKSIAQSDVGQMRERGAVPDSFLYDALVYDSALERKTIVESGAEKTVSVFGKIPRRSVRIPLYNGETTSPDFMYLVNGESSTKLYVVIETKDVAVSSGMRVNEETRIDSARAFFSAMRDEGVNVQFSAQLHDDGIGGVLRRLSK
ncbi:type III restriction-modification system endonuclease [Agrococcus casei]|uniref:type III restriction-modification system endonuclease n=1 Tax=Agrococcus casei TaxID=343512 RepID=UPI003F8ED76F